MIRVKSIAKYLPGPPIHSHEIEERLGWKPGWIEKNSGVMTRYHASAEDSLISMGKQALQQALDQVDMPAEELDLLIFASACFEHPIPHTACLLKQAMDWNHLPFPAFDVDGTCLGFLHALEIASAFIETGRYANIAIVNSEMASRSLDPEDQKTYSLFGDGAVATIVTAGTLPQPNQSYFINFSEGARFAHVPAGGSEMLLTRLSNPPASYFFKMEGRKLLKLTFQQLDNFIHTVEDRFQQAVGTYAKIIPHQASRLGMDMFLKRFNLTDQQVHLNLHRYGNCISASIPLGLCDLIQEEGMAPHQEIILMGTAAGLTMGAITLET
ncbi:MAG: ketoacyl-ACP synthase III [Bacteroidota bacterium]